MTDTVTKRKRSKIMQAIKSDNTKLENAVSKELWSKGIRFRRNVRSLKGTPDISIKKSKLVIFIDSCFWHGCNLHCRMPKSNRNYWLEKIKGNKKRDIEIQKYYKEINWRILRIWEHELNKDFDNTINKIIRFIKP